MEEYQKRILDLLKADRLVEAIKVYRDNTRLSLKDAKEDIDMIRVSADREQALLSKLEDAKTKTNVESSTFRGQQNISRSQLEAPNKSNNGIIIVLVIIIIALVIYMLLK